MKIIKVMKQVEEFILGKKEESLLEKKREYGTAFRAWKFIFGVKKCKGYTPKAAKIF